MQKYLKTQAWESCPYSIIIPELLENQHGQMESFCCIMDILKHNNKNYKNTLPKIKFIDKIHSFRKFYLEQLHTDPKYTFSIAKQKYAPTPYLREVSTKNFWKTWLFLFFENMYFLQLSRNYCQSNPSIFQN